MRLTQHKENPMTYTVIEDMDQGCRVWNGGLVASAFIHIRGAADALADRLNSGDQTIDLLGPMWCEKHPFTVWPHDDCAGPGMWLPNAELRERGIIPPADHRLVVEQLVHYEGWFGDDCRCTDDDCPL